MYSEYGEQKDIVKKFTSVLESKDFKDFVNGINYGSSIYIFDRMFVDTLENKSLMRSLDNCEGDTLKKKTKIFLGKSILKAMKRYNETVMNYNINNLPTFYLKEDEFKLIVKEIVDQFYENLDMSTVKNAEDVYRQLREIFMILLQGMGREIVTPVLKIKNVFDKLIEKGIINKMLLHESSVKTNRDDNNDDDDDNDDDNNDNDDNNDDDDYEPSGSSSDSDDGDLETSCKRRLSDGCDENHAKRCKTE